jgi:DNA-binding transcriptional regulator YhcF (GntR family)
VQLLLDRRDMAEVLGTTAETLSRNFQLLARREVIEICGSHMFRVLNRTRLIAESGETACNIDRIAGMRPHVDPNEIRNICQPV